MTCCDNLPLANRFCEAIFLATTCDRPVDSPGEHTKTNVSLPIQAAGAGNSMAVCTTGGPGNNHQQNSPARCSSLSQKVYAMVYVTVELAVEFVLSVKERSDRERA